MISFFRSFFQSKIGLAISFIFLALIAVAFAASDVTGGATFGGVSSERRSTATASARRSSPPP